MPDVKKKTIDVPFSHGSIDLTDMNGGAHYEDRQGILFEFVLYDGDYTQWTAIYSRIANAVHGRKVKVVLDNDKAYYYNMRLAIDSEKAKKPLSKIILSGTAEPFKYEVISKTEPWLWDPFNFETGVITKPEAVEVDGTATYIAQAGFMPTVPEFFCNIESGSTLTVSDGKRTIQLQNGMVYDPRIKVNGDEEVTLTFVGKGTVEVVYRGGSL